MTMNHFYGWRPDLPDFRDFAYAAPVHVLQQLPPTVDLSLQSPGVYDQRSLGSCTAQAIAAALEFNLIKQGAQLFTPSRLFIYYNERVIIDTVNIDSGAYLRDGLIVVSKLGACPELLWPYSISEFTKKPYQSCYSDALEHQVLSYHRVPRTLSQMKGCLAEGYPFVFGFTVFESFDSTETATSGVANMPQPGEARLGGHAVMAVGYNDETRRFLVKNSGGEEWGLDGYFTLPYDYLLNEGLSDDFWTIRSVEITNHH